MKSPSENEVKRVLYELELQRAREMDEEEREKRKEREKKLTEKRARIYDFAQKQLAQNQNNKRIQISPSSPDTGEASARKKSKYPDTGGER